MTRLASGLRAALGALVLVAALVGCRVQTEVVVDVAEDGSGTVSVGVGLDPDATSRVPDVAAALRVDDLRAAGWDVTAPRVEDDGHTWVRASKPFADPDGFAAVMGELTGPEGALRDFALTEERSFARTTWEVTGTVDLAGGLEAFTDADLAELLGGEPLGASVEELEADLGEPLADVFTLLVSVTMPDGSETTVEPVLGEPEPVAISGSATIWRPDTLVFAGVAAVAALLLLVVAVIGPIVRLRRKRALRPRGRHAAPTWS